MLPLLVLLGTIAGAWYLLIVRPQKDQQTRHGRLVERLQVGDHVLTVGGIYGRVVAVEASSVVLELAPGLTSRIATDGIARIVHGAEAELSTHEAGNAATAQPTPRQAVPDMHPHGDPQQQQQQQHSGHGLGATQQHGWGGAPTMQGSVPQPMPVPQQVQPPMPMPTHASPSYATPAPAYAAPAPAYAGPVPTYAAPVPTSARVLAQAPMQLPAPPPPMHGTTTLRAQVLPALPTYEPRPWGDVAPAAPAIHAQGARAPFLPNLPPPPHLAALGTQPAPQHAPLRPMPTYAPFAPHQPEYAHAPHQPQYAHAPHQPQYAPAPHQPQHARAPQGYAPPAPPLQPYAQPQYAQAPAPAVHAPEPTPPQQPQQYQSDTEPARRTSRAPQGMGSSLRLDDPSIRDTMVRAREERTGLAAEYQRLNAPLVEVGPPAGAHGQGEDGQAHGPQLAGHDTSGVPLFATPGVPGVHPIAQYPASAALAPAGMPRPVVGVHQGATDPALRPDAFQRPTPYTPMQVAAPQPAGPAAFA